METDVTQAERQKKTERMCVRVTGLSLDAEVGIYPSEHGRRQPIRIDLEAEVDRAAAAPDADLSRAVDYAALAERVRRVVASRHHELLEDLARHVADAVFEDPRILHVELTVDKLAALEDADAVGVRYARWR